MSDTLEVDIQDYINLYNKGVRLNRIKPLNNQTYKLFKSSGLDIRVVHRKETYSRPNAYKKTQYFAKANEYFYMIPVTTVKGTIVGFILRGVLKSDYSTVSRTFNSYDNQVPLMFGFDKRFQKYDEQSEKHNKCFPIIVCEGSKDCLMLKRIYPYVVANNTSSMGLNAPVLRNISDSFLLAYDNDKAGMEGIEKDKRVLRGMGAYVDSIKLHDGFKDCADYLGHPKEFEELKKQIRLKLKRLFEIGK